MGIIQSERVQAREPERATSVPSRKSGWVRAYVTRIRLTDTVVVMLATLLAFLFRFGPDGAVGLAVRGVQVDYVVVAVVVGIGWIVALHLSQVGNTTDLGVGFIEFRRVINASFVYFGLIAIVAMAFRVEIARGFLVIAMPLGILLLVLSRAFWRRWLARQRKHGSLMDDALVVGRYDDVAFVVGEIAKSPASGYRVRKVALEEPGIRSLVVGEQELEVVGTPTDVADLARQYGTRAVIIAGDLAGGREQLKRISWQLENVGADLVLANGLTDVAGARVKWRQVDGLPLVTVDLPRYEGARFIMKRIGDIIMSGLALLVLAVPLLIVAILVKRDSPGPAIFRQTRVGVRGEPFSITKFRSMYIDAEERRAELIAQSGQDPRLFKMENDPRITRVGAFIRRYSIDELPQFWDVFRGKMSLVGPRPSLPVEVDQYESHFHRRMLVQPGITGLWQVSGRSNLTIEEAIRLDLSYVENWSLVSDIQILFRTVRVVFAKEGAY